VESALILAAGASSRMGRPKQLLNFRGKSLLRRAVETAMEVPVDQVIVVLGFEAQRLMPELEGTGATVVLNEHWAEGMSTSLRGGLAAVAQDARGVLIYPSDMPFVTPEALQQLMEKQHESGRPATMSEVGGVKGVPVYITRSIFPAMMIQEGDQGGGGYLRAHPDLVEFVHFADEQLMVDLDKPADYRRVLEAEPDFDPEEIDRAVGG
jgi:molybdenum cofactor cytidylyltransferase